MLELIVTGDALKLDHIEWADLSPVLRQFRAYMVQQTDRMFEEAGHPGSALLGGPEVRGVRWEAVKTGYKRRPSGKSISPMSALLQDTGRLRQLAATEITQVTPTSLVMGTRLPYAAAQNAHRPFLFITDEDADHLQVLVDRHYGLESPKSV